MKADETIEKIIADRRCAVEQNLHFFPAERLGGPCQCGLARTPAIAHTLFGHCVREIAVKKVEKNAAV